MEPQGKPGMQGVFGLLLVVGGLVLIVLVLMDLAGVVPSGASNAFGQYNPAGAAKVQPPGTSVGFPTGGTGGIFGWGGKCPDGTVNIGGICTVTGTNIVGGRGNPPRIPGLPVQTGF